MPQWSRDENLARQKYPDERWHARCSRAHATELLAYDHHVVWIGGRAALLRTYQWAAEPVDAWPDELPLEVSFTYASGHPTAPDHIRRLVASLEFTPVEGATGRGSRGPDE
ncbi:MAG: hypothetical protein HOQ30_01900 [Gemmatimonadaceae bacterium]|nr:hypothetical protein [Gemmatimonadaceae bacterium]